jgi:AraC-like DNA-binding protein
MGLRAFAAEDFCVRDWYFVPWYWIDGASDDYRSQGRRHNHLCYMVDGSRSYIFNGQTVEQPPGSMVYNADSSRYLTIPHVREGMARAFGYNIGFDLLDAGGAPFVLDPPVQLVHDPDGAILERFKRLDKLSTGFEPRTIAMRAEILYLLEKLCLVHPGAINPADKHEALSPAIGLIKKQLGDKLTIPWLSETCNMSESTFRRLFKQYAGCTPARYLTILRMRKAEQVYRRYSVNLEEIARSVGFYDAAHMCHAYKKMFGKTFGEVKDAEEIKNETEMEMEESSRDD